MNLIKISIHYSNLLPHTHAHTHTHTHTQLGAGGYIGFPYINLLASDQGCQKQNTYIVSQIYVMELLHIYVVTLSPISDTSPLLS